MSLITTNRTITISRVTVDGDGIRTFTEVDTDINVYINQTQEDLIQGFDNDGSVFAHRCLTDGEHEDIYIGDRITDDLGNQYDVRGKSVFDDLTGVHHQYLLVEAFE